MILFVAGIYFPCFNSRLSLFNFVRKENSVIRTSKADDIKAGTNCVILIHFLPEMVCCHTAEVVTLMWCLKFCSLLSRSINSKNKRDNRINDKPSKQALLSPVFQTSMRRETRVTGKVRENIICYFSAPFPRGLSYLHVILHCTVLVMIVMINVLDNHAFSWQALFSQTRSGKYS